MIPNSTISTSLPVTTSIPRPSASSSSFSIPALDSIVSQGAVIAFSNIVSPMLLDSILSDALSSATPPPGTIPSFKAAFVAYIASSTLSFFSFSSTFESAPTFITPTEPDNKASLSSSFFFI